MLAVKVPKGKWINCGVFTQWNILHQWNECTTAEHNNMGRFYYYNVKLRYQASEDFM